MTIIELIKLAIAYRFRGGGYFATGSDTIVRAVWCLAVTSDVYGLLPAASIESMAVTLAITFVAAYLAIALVPHDFAQNMGSWDYLQCVWFTKWLVHLPLFPAEWANSLAIQPNQDPAKKTIWIASWSKVSTLQKVSFDFLQWMVIGAVRGVIFFLPLAVVMHAWMQAGVACAAFSLFQALAYLIGKFVPFSMYGCEARSSEWGEFLTGPAWGLAILLFFEKVM